MLIAKAVAELRNFQSSLLNSFILIIVLYFSKDTSHFVQCKSKCLHPALNRNVTVFSSDVYPEVKIASEIPGVDVSKPNLSVVNGTTNVRTVTIPSMLELLRFECRANYKVEWGFESYPWIQWDTWTGAIPPAFQNGSNYYTAFVEFTKLQETSLQTRTPICYSVQDPCIQTAVESHSMKGSRVEIKLTQGSNMPISSESQKDKFGRNKNCTLKFGYDFDSQKFYCQETDPNRPTAAGKIFVRPCPDPVSCESLIEDTDCDLEPSFPIQKCSMENQCRTETAFAGNFPGIAVCHSGLAPEHSAAIPYFYAFASFNNSSANKTRRYINWNYANPNEMLQIQTFDRPVYTEQKLSFVCNASYFYLGTGMYFDLTSESVKGDRLEVFNNSSTDSFTTNDYELHFNAMKNELESAKESVKLEDANIGGIGSKLPAIRSLHISNYVFDTPGTYQLACYAPIWNTTEWAKSSTTVVVQESLLPKFDGGNSTVKQYYAPYKRLECIAYGLPKPDLSWARDGGSIPNEISIVTGEQNHTLVWASLTFPKLEFGIHGNFTCTASNVRGTVSKSFIIIPTDKNSATALWILVGLAVTITLLIPLVLYLIWKVRRQRQHIDDLTQEEVEEFINGRPDYIPFHCDMSTYAYYLPYNADFEIPRECLEIDFERILGSGEYGLVLCGLYKNPNPPNGGPPYVKPVAVKTTKPLTNGKEYFKALLSELKIMTYIGKHKNIVNLIGACTQNIRRREVYIATEFCENGSLLVYLRSNRYTFENPCYYAELARASSLSSSLAETSFITFGDTMYHTNPANSGVQYVKVEDLEGVSLNKEYQHVKEVDMLRWSREIAQGMEFLASKKVVHVDLAARNVLLTYTLNAKIGDFGLSRKLDHYNHYTKTAVTPLPLKWMAIECLQNFQFSVESDVWAYGVTLFEIFSMGEIPYSSVQMNGEEFLKALKQGMRLSRPAYAPIDIFDLMMRCWKQDKKQRPSFSDIVKFLLTRGFEDVTIPQGNGFGSLPVSQKNASTEIRVSKSSN